MLCGPFSVVWPLSASRESRKRVPPCSTKSTKNQGRHGIGVSSHPAFGQAEQLPQRQSVGVHDGKRSSSHRLSAICLVSSASTLYISLPPLKERHSPPRPSHIPGTGRRPASCEAGLVWGMCTAAKWRTRSSWGVHPLVVLRARVVSASSIAICPESASFSWRAGDGSLNGSSPSSLSCVYMQP